MANNNGGCVCGWMDRGTSLPMASANGAMSTDMSTEG